MRRAWLQLWRLDNSCHGSDDLALLCWQSIRLACPLDRDDSTDRNAWQDLGRDNAIAATCSRARRRCSGRRRRNGYDVGVRVLVRADGDRPAIDGRQRMMVILSRLAAVASRTVSSAVERERNSKGQSLSLVCQDRSQCDGRQMRESTATICFRFSCAGTSANTVYSIDIQYSINCERYPVRTHQVLTTVLAPFPFPPAACGCALRPSQEKNGEETCICMNGRLGRRQSRRCIGSGRQRAGSRSLVAG